MNQPMQEEGWILKQLKQIVDEKFSNDIEAVAVKKLSDYFTEKQHDSVTYFQTGFKELDELIGGYTEGEFIVLGGRPGMGKTHFLVNNALNLSRNVPVLFYSLDISLSNLMGRMVSALTGIPFEKLTGDDLNQKELKEIARVKKTIQQHQVYLHTNYSASIYSFLSVSRQFIRNQGIRVIILDYVQLLSSQQYRHNREHEMSYISRLLKAFAKEEKVTVIVSCQLSRAVEQRYGDRRPVLSDLRDTGAFEQDADKVFFLYRPEYYGIMKDEVGQNNAHLTELIVAKNRNGIIGKVLLAHDDHFTTFEPFERKEDTFTLSHTRLEELKTVF